MQPCNILVGCDQTYYDEWAVPLLKSINKHNPWINLHCHIVNPTVENSLEVILSKIPIDHPFLVFPLNFAAPKMVVFLG